MIKFTATFEDGTILTRKSNNGYAFAWRVTWTHLDGKSYVETGFSASRENAEKNAKPYLPYGTWRGQSPRDRAFSKEQNAKFLQNCNLRVEIVPAIAS